MNAVPTSQSRAYAVALLIVAVTVAALYINGRVPICTCGDIKLWYGDANGPENSQQITDWYTFSHIIHGFLFYGLFWLLFPRRSIAMRFSLAVAVECFWEFLENTPLIINRYREATISLGYNGDSILNSVSDIAAMAVGFFIAARLPVWLTVLIAVVFEIFTGYMIRDNLTLNIIMLLWPIDAIKHWQAL